MALNFTLLEAIEEKRNDMLHTGLDKGIDHPSTLQISEQLDELINQYQTVLFKQYR